LQAVLLESIGLSALVAGGTDSQRLFLYVLCHLLASVLFSLVVYPLLPERYRRPRSMVLMFLVTLQFAIPVIGSVGTLAGILLALYLPRRHRKIPWNEVPIPELPFKPVPVSAQPLYSQGGLQQVLREAADPNKRVGAVMATKQMHERDRIRILRQALKDPADDVRLLAYAMLDEKEKEISERILARQKALEDASDAESARPIRFQLAQDYWEMAYLGIAQGGVKTHFLRECEKQLNQILAEGPDPGALRLMGRVYLERADYDAAEHLFNEAMLHGMPAVQVLPYLAEIAFYQRQFGKLQSYLHACEASGRVHPAFRPVMNFWLHPENAGGQHA
ncbi:MAG: polysaccharide biosynthesis protein, partial [Gammaproteobacteria bacterium]